MAIPGKGNAVRGNSWIIAAICSAIAAVHLWAGALGSGTLSTPTPQGYYAQMSEAFLSGQSYLKMQPDPRLKTLPNPWLVEPGQNIPRLPESSIFNDRYYLYFSATPSVLLFIPWKLLTGRFLTDEAGTLILGLVGLALMAQILWGAWRRWFHELSPVWPALALATTALGTRVPQLLLAPMVHHVPVVAAHAFSMAAVAAVLWALGRPSWRGQAVGLALASLGWGLAVTCRPNYIFSLPVLVIPLGYFLRAWPVRDPDAWRRWGWFLAAVLVPAAGAGLAQAAYNYVRFASITEFGMRYQVGSIDQLTLQLFAVSNFWPNLRIFFLAFPDAPWFSGFFPFFPGWAGYWGVLVSTPSSLLAVAFPLLCLGRRRAGDGTMPVLGLTLFAAFLLNTFSILLLTLLVGVAERYLVDFVPLAGVLAAIAGLAILASPPRLSRPWPVRIGSGAVVALLLVSLSQSVLMIFIRSDPAWRMRPLARLANRAAYAIEQLRGIQHGPLVLQLRFDRMTPGRREPLVVSARGNDVLFVEYVGTDAVRIGFCHRGAYPVLGPVVVVTRDRVHELVADLGNLYPPRDHPLLAGLPDDVADILAHRLVVTLDGQTVLESGSEYYAGSPGEIEIGANSGQFVAPGSFSGRIEAISHRAIPALADLRGPAISGPVRLELKFPDFSVYHREPLLSSGRWGGGDLIYVTYVAPGKIRFGHDSWGGGAIESGILSFDPAQPQVVEIDTPALGRDFAGSRSRHFRLSFNGQLVCDDDRPFNASRQAGVFLGFNGCNSSTSSLSFSGAILSVKPAISFGSGPQADTAAWGALRVQLRFPEKQAGRNEPLLVAGRNGAADVIYVQYVDDGHIRLGYDHWGKGGSLSEPIAIEPRAIQSMEFSLGSLYPPLTDANWRGLAEAERRAWLGMISVRLNDRPVLSLPGTAYPATSAEIEIGRNGIGASTCDELFSGKILQVDRLPLAGR